MIKSLSPDKSGSFQLRGSSGSSWSGSWVMGLQGGSYNGYKSVMRYDPDIIGLLSTIYHYIIFFWPYIQVGNPQNWMARPVQVSASQGQSRWAAGGCRSQHQNGGFLSPWGYTKSPLGCFNTKSWSNFDDLGATPMDWKPPLGPHGMDGPGCFARTRPASCFVMWPLAWKHGDFHGDTPMVGWFTLWLFNLAMENHHF